MLTEDEYMSDMSELKSSKFKAIRRELGLSMTELGKKLGVNRDTIARYENSDNVLPMALLAIQFLRYENEIKKIAQQAKQPEMQL